VTIYKSILAILVSPTNPKVIAIVSIALDSILFNKLFLPSTITVVVIMLYSKVVPIYQCNWAKYIDKR
jgi:hypothetical protein